MATYTRRYEKLREYMRECSLDAIVITATENYLYFSGYNNPDGLMIVTADESVVFADFRYFEAAKEKCFPVCTVKEQKGGSLDEWLKTSGASRIGFENSDISVARFDKMKKTTDEHKIELCPVDETITEIRSMDRDDSDVVLRIGEDSAPLRVPLPAVYNIYNALAAACAESSRTAIAFARFADRLCSAASTAASAWRIATTARSTAVVRRKPWNSDCTAEKPQRHIHSGSVQFSEAEAEISGIRSATA